MTADERFAAKSKMLDQQIAMKAEMKKILTPEQFEKWEGMRSERREKMENKQRKYRKHHRR